MMARWLRAYGAALFGVGLIVPILTLVATMAALFSPLPLPSFTGSSVLYGFTAGLVLWLIVALPFLPLAYPASANRGSYAELLRRAQPMHLRIADWRASAPEDASTQAGQAMTEAEKHLDELQASLKRPGLDWVSGDGYIAAWERLHRAEEALIGAASADELGGEIQHDRVRLHGAVIPQQADLLKLLDDADRVLLRWWSRGHHLERARRKSKEVRNAINIFRDDGFNGLLRLRNQTLILFLLTGLNLYALLAMAITAGAKRDTLLSAGGFYLVGAVVGLFSRLYQQATTGTTVEDYGLATARKLTIPVYSGLAGVAGVLLYGLTASLASAGTSAREIPTLDQVLSVVNNPFGVILAAAFGAAPDLLLKGLSQMADKYKGDIASTQSSGSATA